MIYKILIIGHIIGRFYVQTNKMVDKKKDNFGMLLKSCTIYFFVLLIGGISFVTKEDTYNYIILIVCMSVFSGFMDYLKIKLDKANLISSKYTYIMLIVDQVIHIGVLIGGSYLIGIKGVQELKVLGTSYEYVFWSHKLIALIGLLICGKPASTLVKAVFSIQETKIKESKKGETESGSLIGMLEREIIFILGMMGQFSAIGFVLAAKSLARYKQLENQKFAEKYIVGTLLSSLISLTCVAVYYYLR